MMQRFMSLGRLSDRKDRKRAATRVLLSVMLVSAAALAPAVAEPPLEPPYELVINSVVDATLDDLIAQMRRQPALYSMFAPAKKVAGAPENKDAAAPGRVVIMVDTTVDREGLRSAAVELLDPLLVQIARQKLPDAEVIDGTGAPYRPAPLPPYGQTSVSSVQYILGGRLSSVDTLLRTSKGTFRFDLLLTDTKTDYIVAQASVRFAAKDVNLEPLNCCVSH